MSIYQAAPFMTNYIDDLSIAAPYGEVIPILTELKTKRTLSYGFHLRMNKCPVWWPLPPAQRVQNFLNAITAAVPWRPMHRITLDPTEHRRIRHRIPHKYDHQLAHSLSSERKN